MSFIPVYVYFIAVCFIASLFSNWTVEKPPVYLRYFPYFLFTTLSVELLGSYLLSNRQNNLFLYNFFTTLEFCFYLWVISRIITNDRVIKLIWLIIPIYLLISVINILFIQGMRSFHTVTYAMGCLLIVIFSVYYFFELFRRPQSVDLKTNPAFWICTGLLFFYCCGFPLYGLTNLLYNISTLIIRNFHGIIIILNIFLYTLFTIGFLCRIRTRKYTLSRS